MSDRHFRVIVVSGGIVGCNVLYHLSKAGWTDIALLERLELTAGSTWHSSGHIAHYVPHPTLCEFIRYTVAQLPELQRETGQDLGLLNNGSLRLATTTARVDEYAQFIRTMKPVGLPAELISAQDAAARFPLMNPKDVLGALYLPEDACLNPADVTQALATAARSRGATIVRNMAAIAFSRTNTGEWCIETNSGSYTCEHVVSATGFFARQTFSKLGLRMPVAVLSHQYLITDDVDEIHARREAQLPRLPILRHPDIRLLVREEGAGLFVSVYEKNAGVIFKDGVPETFGMELLPSDLESIEPYFEAAMQRVPCLERTGIKNVVHGPLPWTPDFFPFVGPIRDLPNFWAAEGLCFGISLCGGVANSLVRWMVDGDPGRDLSWADCGRFGAQCTDADLDARSADSYRGVYKEND